LDWLELICIAPRAGAIEMDFPIIQLRGINMSIQLSAELKEAGDKADLLAKVDRSKSTGNRIKFQLEFMFMMLAADRQKEAGQAYDRIIAMLDDLA
jgi:hypothetical protein